MTQQIPPITFSTATKHAFPYAIVAASSLIAKSSSNAALPVLKVSTTATAGDLMSMTVGKHVLYGESTILRYLVRSQNTFMSTHALYPEQPKQQQKLQECKGVDEWLVEVSKFDVGKAPEISKLTDKIEKAVAKSAFLVSQSKSITLADLSAWAFFKTAQTLSGTLAGEDKANFKAWFDRVDAVPEVKEAVKIVDDLIKDHIKPSSISPATKQPETQHATKHNKEQQKEQKEKSIPAISIDELIKSTKNPIQIFRNEIARMVASVLNCPEQTVADALETGRGQSSDQAVFGLPVPKLRLPGNPAQMAQKVANEVQPNALIEEISARGPFLNFSLSQSVIRNSVIPIIVRERAKYGTSDMGNGKTVIVEFSSPNIAKPFHAGHLRSTIIGNFIRNVHKALGYNTIAMNYLGDWGKQYGLLAVGFSKFGNEEELVRDPIKHLFDVYVKISAEKEKNPEIDQQAFAYFKRMEEGDQDALALWKRFRELSIVKYTDIYARLNIEFDIYSGESKYSEKIGPAIDMLLEKKIATDSVIVHKGLLDVGFAKFGSEEELKKDPIGHILDVLVKAHAEKSSNPEMNAKSEEVVQKLKAMKPTEFPKDFERFKFVSELSLGTNENQSGRLNLPADSSKWQNQIENLRKLDQIELVVDLTQHKIEPARIRRGDGATLYLTRDIAAAMDRKKEHGFEKMFYIVGAAQDLHMKQLFKILECSGNEWSKDLTHINFGMVKGMSTRKGTVVFLEEILNEAKSTMHSVMQQNAEKYAQIKAPETVADIVGISAVIVQDMSSRRIKDYEFNWNRITSFEGDTGPYLQYAHSRLCSIERKYLESLGMSGDNVSADILPFEFKPELLKHLEGSQKASELIYLIAQYPDIVHSLPARQFESSILVVYLFTLCHKVSSCYEELYVMGREKEVAEARLWLYWSTKIALCNGMKLLGLKPLERM